MNNFIANLSVKNKLLAIALMFLAALMGVIIFTIYTLQQQEGDATVLDVAGRQRMLTQKFTKELLDDLVLGVATTEALTSSKTSKLFEQSLQALRNGGDTFSDLSMTDSIALPANTDPEIEQKLAQVDDVWAQLQGAAYKAVGSKPGTPIYQQSIAEIRTLNIKALAVMNGAVTLMAESARQRVRSMVNVEWGILFVIMPIAIWFTFKVGSAITRPLAIVVDATRRITIGDMSVDKELETIKSQDELGVLASSYREMISVVNDMQSEIIKTANGAKDGRFDARCDSSQFEGVRGELLEGINGIIEAYVVPMRNHAGYLDRISRGDIPPLIHEEYKGDFNDVKSSFNRSISTINNLLEESHTLIDAAHKGNLDARGDTEKFEGVWVELIDGLNGVFQSTVDPVRNAGEVLRSLSEGDLRHEMEGEYAGEYAALQDSVNSTIRHLEATVIPVKEAASYILMSASEIFSGNNNLSDRTDKQSSSLQETASSMEQLISTVRNNAHHSTEANGLAAGAQNSAEHGTDVVKRAMQAMEEINGSSNKISEIIGVIDEIAFQTNLLALNASVEAARAGEQGRGFAVVATEVRNLAGRSATAAKEIKELIQDSLKKVHAGTALVNESGETLGVITDRVTKVSEFVSEINAASAEQTAGIEQVNIAITGMDEIVQQNAVLAERTSVASEGMRDKAEELEQRMHFFKVNHQPEVLFEPAEEQVVVEEEYVETDDSKPVTEEADSQFSSSGVVSYKSMDESDEWEEF